MACCVVLSHRSTNVRKNDSCDNPSCFPSSSRSQAHPNPESTNISITPAGVSSFKRGRPRVNDCGSKTVEVSQEPWAKLLSQAKEQSQISSVKAKKCRNQTVLFTEKEIETEQDEETNLVKIETLKSEPSVSVETQINLNSRPKGKTTKNVCQPKQLVSEEEVSLLKESSSSDSTHAPIKRGRKRASSVEWNHSASKSAGTLVDPRDIMKTDPRKKKRAASIDSEWICNESDSDCNEEKSSGGFDSFHQCGICMKKFSRPWRLRVHLRQHLDQNIGDFICDEDGCSKRYHYRWHLERHKSRSHSDLVITSQVLCPAEGCNRILASQSGLKRHINKLHAKQNLKFSCSYCDKGFSKIKQLRYHIAEHTGEPPLRCEKCNAGCFSDGELKRHMRSHKEYPCTLPGCEQIFSNYSAHQKHCAEHNRCFQNLCCAHCKKVFKLQRDLRVHVLTHLDNKPIYRCPHDSCPRFYYHPRNLKSHLRVNHEKTSKFACTWPDCDKQCYSKRRLDFHLNVHQNGVAPRKPRKCPQATRKDKGKPKRAMASKLTGLVVPPEVDKELITADRVIEMSESETEENRGTASCDWKSHLKNAYVKLVDILPKPTQFEEKQQIHCDAASSTLSTEKVQTHEEEKDNTSDSIVIGVPLQIGSHASSVMEKTFVVGEGGELILVEENSLLEDSKIKASEGLITSDVMENDLVQNMYCTTTDPYSPPEKGSTAANDATFEPIFTVSGDVCSLSATLCAETTVECPSFHADTEVLLLIPKAGQISPTSEVSSDAVVKALSGAFEVYSVAGKNKTAAEFGSPDCNQQSEATHQESLKIISVNDPSVSSILQPLIQNLASKPDDLNAEPKTEVESDNVIDKMTTKLSRRKMINPAYFQKLTHQKIVNKSAEDRIEMKTDDGNGKSQIQTENSDVKGKAETEHSNKKCKTKTENNYGKCKTETGYNNEEHKVETENFDEKNKVKTENTTENGEVILSEKGRPLQRKLTNPVNLLNGKDFIKATTSSVPGENGGGKVEKGSSLLKKIRNPANAQNRKDTKRPIPPVPKEKNVDHMSSPPSASKPAEQKVEPAALQHIIAKLAKFINSQVSGSPLTSVMPKACRSFRNNLQGPTQDQTESDCSSVSESDDSFSDSGSDDGHNDYNSEEEDAVEDHPNDNGDGGNEDDDNEDDEDEADEQPEEEEEDNDEDEEDDGENNYGEVQLNGDDNNNDDADGSDPNDSERRVDHESTNGHQNLGDGSDFGVDRAASPDEDDIRSTHSGDLIIDLVTEDDECSPKSSKLEDAIHKSPPEPVVSPEKGYSLCRRRSTRLKQLKVSQEREKEKSSVLVESVKKTRQNANRRTFTKEKYGNKVPDCAETIRTTDKSEKTEKTHVPTLSRMKNITAEGIYMAMLEAEIEDVAEETWSEKVDTGAQKKNKGKENAVVKSARERSKSRNQFTQQTLVQVLRKKRPNQRTNLGSIDCSDSGLSPLKRKRKCNISDDDSDDDFVSKPKKIPKNMVDALEVSVESGHGPGPSKGSSLSPEELPDPLQVSMRETDLNMLDTLKTLPVSPSLDPLHIPPKDKKSLSESMKKTSRTSIACKQLSASSWISVLRQASKAMKLSPTTAED